MRVIGPESPIPMQGGQTPQVNLEASGSTSGVVAHVGVEQNVEETGLAIVTTGATSTVIREDPVSDHNVVAACRGFHKRWANKKSEGSEKSEALDDASSFDPDRMLSGIMTPSIMDPDSPEQSQHFDDGVIGTADASSAMSDNAFLSNAKWSNIQLPWESKVMQPIFDAELLPKVDLRQDISWKAALNPPVDASKQKPEPVAESMGSLKPVFVKCVKAIRGQTFIETRERDMQAAISKWHLVLRSNSSASDVGRQIERDPTQAFEILRASMGVKSPNAVLSRANAMLAYMRWHSLELTSEPLLPMQEEHAWRYVSHLSSIHAPPSRATSFVQACRFAHHILGFRGALDVVTSRRITGLSEIQLADKEPAKQARPLTVYELQQLHRIAGESFRHVKDRVLASQMLLMAYCRHGYIQLRTRFHRKEKLVATNSCFIIWGRIPRMDSAVVGKSHGSRLAIPKKVKGPLMPAPHAEGEGWSQRLLTSSEVTQILKSFLEETSDVLLSSQHENYPSFIVLEKPE